MGADALVRAKGLRKTFGAVVAVEDLSFELRAGEVLGLLGQNGAGKTTTLKLLLGLLKASGGRAEILGHDCSRDARQVKERIGYTPDEPAFHDFLTGHETLELVRAVRSVEPAVAAARIESLAAMLELEDRLDVLTHEYSHGMKKKLALLAALIHAPPVLLLDEPTNGLDPSTALRVRELLRGHAAGGGGVLVSTHLLDMADRLCDGILVLHRGRLLALGTPAEIRARAGVAADASLEDAFLKLVV